MAARRAAAARAGLGRLARMDAALIEAPQWGQVSGVLGARGVLRFMRLLSFGVYGDVFGCAENRLEFAENHDDQAGRMFGEEIPDGVAGDLFCLLCAHGLAAAAGAGIIRRRDAAVNGGRSRSRRAW